VSDAHWPEIVIAPAAQKLHRLPPPVRRLARMCDGTRTLAALSTLSALTPSQVE
jgi:hypothetical protein